MAVCRVVQQLAVRAGGDESVLEEATSSACPSSSGLTVVTTVVWSRRWFASRPAMLASVWASTALVGSTSASTFCPLLEQLFVLLPERIDPGVEAHAPDSTPRVVGGVTDECTVRAIEVLRHTASTMHSVSSPEAAEMTKLLENTFRAVNIALANEFSGAARELMVLLLNRRIA